MGLFDGFLDNFNIFNNNDDEHVEYESQNEEESDIIAYCDSCSKAIKEDDDYITTISGANICEDCQDGYVQCEGCGEYLHKESANEYPDPHYSIKENKLYNLFSWLC